MFTNPRPAAEELQKYYQSDDYISHSNIRKGILPVLYQRIRKYTLKRKYRLLEKYQKPGNLLDVGCGTGEFLALGKQRGWNVTGIEPSTQAREQAVSNFKLEVGDESLLDHLPSGHFNMITLWHVLEHVPLLNERMQTLHRLLHDDGLLVIALPNSGSWDARHYHSAWAAYDLPRHLYHFTPVTSKHLLEKHRFTVLTQKPMVFDSFYIGLLSEPYRTGKKNLPLAFYTGLYSNLWAFFHQKNYSSFILLSKKEKS
ncbi:MAG: class I SAM-dependent methyltransferase [Bacteroidetes bacterium]|nr:class I SAM-dependent methyltransferase [Bacteroidota bacterium]